jgi:hypothetical protein
MLRWWHEVHEKKKGKTMLLSTWLLLWYTPEEWAQKVFKIDESLKMQSTLLKDKHQPKYKCPCCEKLWGSKHKSNQHFFTCHA